MRFVCASKRASFEIYELRAVCHTKFLCIYLHIHSFWLPPLLSLYICFFFLLLFHTKICFKFKHRIMHRKPRNAYFCLWIHFMWNLHCCASRVCVPAQDFKQIFNIILCNGRFKLTQLRTNGWKKRCWRQDLFGIRFHFSFSGHKRRYVNTNIRFYCDDCCCIKIN